MKLPRKIIEIYEFFQDWYVSKFYRCRKCNGRLDLKHEGAQNWKNIYPLQGGWYHFKCSITRSQQDIEFDEKLRKMSEGL